MSAIPVKAIKRVRRGTASRRVPLRSNTKLVPTQNRAAPPPAEALRTMSIHAARSGEPIRS
jgi:hypothetical protein